MTRRQRARKVREMLALLAAMLVGGAAEAAWTADATKRVPPEGRDFADFVRRMTFNRKRLIAAGVNCAPLE